MKSDLLPDIMNVLVNVDIPFVSKKQEDIVYRDIFWNSIISSVIITMLWLKLTPTIPGFTLH